MGTRSHAGGVMLDWVAQWSLLLGIVGLAWTIAYIAPRMVRQACANAEVRARRAAYEAYSAEIIDITLFLPARDAEGNIA